MCRQIISSSGFTHAAIVYRDAKHNREASRVCCGFEEVALIIIDNTRRSISVSRMLQPRSLWHPVRGRSRSVDSVPHENETFSITLEYE